MNAITPSTLSTFRVVGYIRVSTDEQAKNGISLDVQRAKIEAYATLHNAELLAIIADEGVSTGKKASKREGLQRAIGVACTHNAALVVYKLDRLARSVKETLEISECLRECDADLVSICESIDTTSAAGKMVFHVMAALAEFERNQIKERVSAAMSHLRDQNKRISRHVPFGKRLSADGIHLEDNPDEIALIERIKGLKASGLSTRQISAMLRTEGVKSRTGNLISTTTVHEIVNL